MTSPPAPLRRGKGRRTTPAPLSAPADRSCRLSPDGWARRAVAAFDDCRADLIVAEVKNGGDLVEQTIRTARRSISYRKVHASRGKQIRAQPVAALYEQGKVSHVESFPELEEQLT